MRGASWGEGSEGRELGMRGAKWGIGEQGETAGGKGSQLGVRGDVLHHGGGD